LKTRTFDLLYGKPMLTYPMVVPTMQHTPQQPVRAASPMIDAPMEEKVGSVLAIKIGCVYFLMLCIVEAIAMPFMIVRRHNGEEDSNLVVVLRN